MLTRLLPDQISEYWDIISPAIEASLPPIASGKEERMNRVLMSLLSSQSQCWAGYRVDDNEKRVFEGIMVTKIYHDYISNCKSLLIYSLYSYSKVSKRTWLNGFKSIIKYAMSHDCEDIVAYTSVPFLIDMAKKLGGNVDYTFVKLPLNVKDQV